MDAKKEQSSGATSIVLGSQLLKMVLLLFYDLDSLNNIVGQLDRVVSSLQCMGHVVVLETLICDSIQQFQCTDANHHE